MTDDSPRGIRQIPDKEILRMIRSGPSGRWYPGAPPTWKSLAKYYGVHKGAFSTRETVVSAWKKKAKNARCEFIRAIHLAIDCEAETGTLSSRTFCDRVGMKTKAFQNMYKIAGFSEAFAQGLRRSFDKKRERLIVDAKDALKDPHPWLRGQWLCKTALARHLKITVFVLSRLQIDDDYKAAYKKYVAEDERIVLTRHLGDLKRGFIPSAVCSEGRPLNAVHRISYSVSPAKKANKRPPCDCFEKFIKTGKSSPTLKGAVWDSIRWEPTLEDSSNRLRRAHRSVGALIFSNLETSSGKGSGQAQKTAMIEPYLSFAKADTKLYQEEADVSFSSLVIRARAHRFLEKIFRDHRLTQIKDLTLVHFYLAEERAAAASGSKAGAYSTALYLAAIGAVVDHWQLCARPIGYRVRLKEPTRGDSLTREGQEAGMRKMISPDVLSELARISSDPPNEETKLIIRIVDLLLVGGFRIGEALSLPYECWEEDESREIYTNGATGNKTYPCAITYAAEKASDFRPKPLSPSAVEVARRAIDDLRELCRPAREMAKWMKRHPGRLKPLYDLNPDEWISRFEVCERLGFSVQAYAGWILRNKVQLRFKNPGDPTSPQGCRVGDVELLYLNSRGSTEVIRMPSGRTLDLSEALIVTTAEGCPWLPRALSYSMFSKRLCPDKWHRSYGTAGILPEGLMVRSHQFRHWLNTIADEGGLSEIDIAQFFGRKSLSQNVVYKHGTVAQRAEAFKELIREGKVHGQVARIASALSGAELDSFLNAAVGIVHVTPIGVCVHDFSALPCQHHHICFMGCGDYMRNRSDDDSRNVLLDLRRREIAALESSKRLLCEEGGDDNEFISNAIETSEKKIAGIDASLAIDSAPTDRIGNSVGPTRIFPGSKTRLIPITG